MSRRFLHVTDGTPDVLAKRLPSELHTVEINPDDGLPWVNHSPKEVRKSGDLARYGWYVVDVTTPPMGETDKALPLLLSDCSFDGTTATATQRIEIGPPFSLTDHKQGFYRTIEGVFDEMKGAGFDFAGHRFPLLEEGREKMMGVHQVKDDPALTFPLVWGNIDDSATIELKNPAEIRAFYLTALGTFRALEDACTVYKGRIRACVDRAAVDAEWAVIAEELGLVDDEMIP